MRLFARTLILAGAFFAFHTAVVATPVVFEGSIDGHFNSGGTSLRALSFTAASDFLGLADQGPGGDQMSLDLGTFTLNRPGLFSPAVYVTDHFTLDVVFAEPLGIIEGDSHAFTANVVGAVFRVLGGVVAIHFPTQDVPLTFQNANGQGSFTLTINNLNVTLGIAGTGPSSTAHLTGSIHDVDFVAPEPATSILLGSALIGLGLLVRRHVRR